MNEGSTILSLEEYTRMYPLSEYDVIRIGIAICEELKRYEGDHQLHGNVRPGQILVDAGGNFYLNPVIHQNRFSKEQMDYLAPEAYRGDAYRLDIDIYALGMVLYRYLNYNRIPTVERRMSGEPLPDPAGGSEQLHRVVARAVAYRPGQRYQTVWQFQNDLKYCLQFASKNSLQDGEQTGTVPIQSAVNSRYRQAEPERKSSGVGTKIAITVLLGVAGILAVLVVSALLLNPQQKKGKTPDAGQEIAMQHTEKSGDSEKKYPQVTEVPDQTEISGKSETSAVYPGKTGSYAADEEIESAEVIPTEQLFTEEDKRGYVSGRVQQYKGTTYTVLDVDKDGWKSISGNFTDTLLVYRNQIYWRNSGKIGSFPCELIRMNLDGTQQQVLVSDIASDRGMAVWDNVLYYTANRGNGVLQSRKIDLETLEVSDGPGYTVIVSDEDHWVVRPISGNTDEVYVTEPGFENPQQITWDPGTILGISGDIVYYQVKTDSGYSIGEMELDYGDADDWDIILSRKPIQYVNHCLIYVEEGSQTILHRYDFETGQEKTYDLGGLKVHMGGRMYEIDGVLYFTHFETQRSDENTEFWGLNLQDGSYTCVGKWYNETATDAY